MQGVIEDQILLLNGVCSNKASVYNNLRRQSVLYFKTKVI